MTAPWADWNHILKLDPDKDLPDDVTYGDLLATGTDAIEIGGTMGMTEENMAAVIEACAEHDVPLYQEPSDPSVVVEDDALDGYLIPTVFNAGSPFWITGAHKEWVRIDGDLDWDRTWTEAYIVMNPDADVAVLTEADCEISAEDVASYATVAERMFGQEIVYVEYSGMYGDVDVVEAASNAVSESTLFYGGGIHDYDSAHRMATHADVIVVGNLAHDEGVDAVRETVEAANDA
ncbi:putative phosphoglycerol geranylgeranyltransferase [Halobacteria archaeon AArc-m2/3/4]|uniref:Geranylgeranylglyceryl phosphate synthase n=1 Tax=Natronoglomus mannanivorans TaxID=2979990 RepID=A0AAP2YXM2_9EURY|nr:putative phosphoglycerol geranylgeranyltransferase [Halobacteria archaeon AArc-xg1-1]MCU4973368.1 putative phosphoglycerol geranylgeranyltransferase [Halobacteria archaeon AArc-m2/3/4]